MELLNCGDFAKLLFHADVMNPMCLSTSKQIDALVDLLNAVCTGAKGTSNIINAETGCGKTMLMRSFFRELTDLGKSYIYQTSQQFVTNLILAISRDGISPLLHKT